MNPNHSPKWFFEPTSKHPRYIRPEPRKPFGIQNVRRQK